MIPSGSIRTSFDKLEEAAAAKVMLCRDERHGTIFEGDLDRKLTEAIIIRCGDVEASIHVCRPVPGRYILLILSDSTNMIRRFACALRPLMARCIARST